ncbi:MAG TPA: DUF2235 domain-containing protein [Sphingomicrobium sp.]|nr:DUF2235 domain-containing protein [Sphingomicrobium sp.]
MEREPSSQVDVTVKSPGPPKRLVVCFDGTWNSLDARTPTNVVLTAESVVPMAPDGKAQAMFYDEGVGTSRFERLAGGMFGAGLIDKLGDAYRFLTFNYTPGDEIYVFGFSRGAFTARSFVGMLRNCGIVSRPNAGRIKEAIAWYRMRRPSTAPDSLQSRHFRAEVSPNVCTDEGEDAWRQANIPNYAAGSATLLQIRYLGVWDTVGALGVPTRYRLLSFFNRKFQFHDTALSHLVQSGRHAVAIDERRKDFIPTLWSNVDELNRDAGSDPNDPLAPYQERWFPGVHCGVGGGGDFRGLSDQALEWVWDGAQRAGLALDTSPGSKPFELAPDPRAPLSPFDEQSLPFLERVKSELTDRLWRKADRASPAVFRDVSSSARRRWKFDGAALPEGKPYRPPPLLPFAAQLDACPALPQPEPGTFNIVRVEPGDTLPEIAERSLGDSNRWKEIFELNADIVEDPNHIYPGMPLRVPKTTELPSP